MTYKFSYWRMKRKYKREKENADRLGKLHREYRKENTRLRRQVTLLQDGYIVEWCDTCKTQITMLWDPGKDGIIAYCPKCGCKMLLCDSCQYPCDYDYGTEECVGQKRTREMKDYQRRLTHCGIIE